jgi:hypothetical protein
MRILTSPAKTLDFETSFTLPAPTQPVFLDEAEQLVGKLRSLSADDIQELMGVSDAIATRTKEQFVRWQKEHTQNTSRPAIAAYKGDVYRQIDIKDYTDDQVRYLQDTLRIISGLYGMLRPLDLIQPYRLEMKTKVPSKTGSDLYSFWGSRLTDYLEEEMGNDTDEFIINVASQEYNDAVQFASLPCPVVDIDFKQNKNGKLRTVGILAKRARGMMIDYCVRNKVTDREGLKGFNLDGYQLADEQKDRLVFVSG